MEEVRNWLRGRGLEQYASRFEEEGWDTLDILQHMGPGDIETCISKVGHRKKFEVGLQTHPPTGGASALLLINTEISNLDKEAENILHKTNSSDELQTGGILMKETSEESQNKVLLNRVADDNKYDDTSIDIQSQLESSVNIKDTGENDFTEICDSETQSPHGLIDIVCVKGARNKILKTNLLKYNDNDNDDDDAKEDRKSSKSVCPREYLTLKSNVEKTQQENDLVSNGPSGASGDSCSATELATVEDIERSAQLMTSNSGGSVIQAHVKHSKHVTIAQKAEVYHIHRTEVKKQRDNFKGQIASFVENYKRKDHLFVETKPFRELLDILESGHWAFLTGKPGDGKTSMAAHLLLKYEEKGFEPLMLTNADDWKGMVKGYDAENRTQGQFVMIDDMFGTMSLDDRKVNEWISVLDIMHTVVEEGNGSLIVICTSRTYIFKDVKAKLERFAIFQNTSMVDLTEKKFALTTEEKLKIWSIYTAHYHVKSTVPFCVYSNTILPHGFPHCVELYCSNAFLRQKGYHFFENPMRYVRRELKNFKENDKMKYCSLLLILLNENRLEESYLQQLNLSNPPKHIMEIFKAAGLSSAVAHPELIKALKSLANTYVLEDIGSNTYHFSHHSIKENLAYMFIRENPLHAIEKMSFEYIIGHTRWRGNRSGENESFFVLPSFCTNALVERLVKEIKNGNIELVCHYQAWDDDMFVEKWLEYILKGSTSKEINSSILRDIFFIEGDVSHTKLKFMETLIYAKKEKVLIKLLNNVDIVGWLKTQKQGTAISHALLCACFLSKSLQLVLKLIQAGADINIVVSYKEVYRFLIRIREMERRFSWSPEKVELAAKRCTNVFNPVLCSVFAGHTSLMNLLLARGGKIFIENKPIALIVAVDLDYNDMVESMLQRKVPYNILCQDLNMNGQHQTTANSNEPNLAIWNCRFTMFVKPLNKNCVLSLIHLAKSEYVINILLQKGISVNTKVKVAGVFELMPHCIFRLKTETHSSCLVELLQAGLDISEMWNEKSPLNYLVHYWQHSLYREIEVAQRFFPTEYESSFMLPMAFEMSKLLGGFVLKKEINCTDENKDTPLHELCLIPNKGRISNIITKLLLLELRRHGANLNQPNGKGITPVMLALRNCCDIETVLICVSNRQPKLVDSFGRGYFHYLAFTKLEDDDLDKVVNLLLEEGEDINLRDANGNVPIFGCTSGSFPAFCRAGADIHVVNNGGQNIFFHILERGIDKNSINVFENAKQLSVNLHTVETSGRTLMHYLMMSQTDGLSSFKAIFDDLLLAGCSLELQDKAGTTPLMLASRNTSFTKDFLTFFLEKHANLYCTDSSNRSILHHLIANDIPSNRKLNILRLLLNSTNDLIELGSNIIVHAVQETSCDHKIILELLKHRKNNCPDDLNVAVGLLQSRRSVTAKIDCFIELLQSGNMRVSLRHILLNDRLDTKLKSALTPELIKEKLIRPEDIVSNKQDIVQLLTWLKDDTAKLIFRGIYKHAGLRSILADWYLYLLLCRQNFTKSLKFLIKHEIPLKQIYNDGNSLLHILVKYVIYDDQLVKISKLLMERNAAVSHPNRNMMTSLHVVCSIGQLKPQSTYLLIENMHVVDQLDSFGMTALQYLCSYKTKNLQEIDICVYLAFCLICKEADVDKQNTEGQTSLMIAAQQQPLNESLLSLLIQHSKDVNKQDANGNTVLHFLARSPVSDDIKAALIGSMLKKAGCVTLINKDSLSSFGIIKSQIRSKKVGLRVLAEFIPFEIDCNQNDIFEVFVRHMNSKTDDSHESLKAVKDIILRRGVDVNIVHDYHCCTMMMVASQTLRPAMIKCLLKLQADPNIRDMIGYSCLSWLLYSRELKNMSVNYWIYIGADALGIILNKCSVFWNKEDIKLHNATQTRRSVGHSACFRIVEKSKKKALEVLHALLSGGADPNLPDITGKTSLHHFVESPLADVFICPAISMLIEYGADVNYKDCEGMTPLMACAQFPGRKSRRLIILIAAGANIKEVVFLDVMQSSTGK